MAGVYAGRAVGVAGFERLVAIKVLHPHLAYEEEFISMFLDEARLAARIRHPNVVATLDISDSDGDGYFIVMEYIEGDHFGGLLGKAARGGERLPTPVVVRVVLDALGGLNAAHNLVDETGTPLELVHRDVSPHNVMVGKDGISRLTDFGVAKAQVRLSSTRAGQFKGKLSYMAPEQASTGMADQRSDLFSMAIILWEGLTGRRLFRAENNAATLNKILREPIPMPSELFPELTAFDAVLTKALSREPAERYQTAEDLLEAIESASHAVGGVASTRRVAKEVARWDGEKLAAEAARLRDAMNALGHTDLHEAQMPMPREGSVSRVSGPRPSPAGPDEPTVAASVRAVAEERGARKRKLLILSLLLFTGIASAVVGWVMWGPNAAPENGAAAAPNTAAQPDSDIAGHDIAGHDIAGHDTATSTTAGSMAHDPAEGPAAPVNMTEPAIPTADAVTHEAEATDSDLTDAESARRRRQRRRALRDQHAVTQPVDPPTMTPVMAPVMHEPPPDDLLANPYRR